MVHWTSIAAVARLAPTPHNTQPFRLRPLDGTSAEIVALPERFLPHEDHGNRYVASAFGIFWVALERAAASAGLQLNVDAVPQLGVAGLHRRSAPVVMGLARLTGQSREVEDHLLDVRRTSRIPYNGVLVDQQAIHRFSATAARFGNTLAVHSDPGLVERILRLNVDAVLDNLQLDEERREIESWYRTGPTPAYGDGLWQVPMNQSAFEMRAAFAMPRQFAWPVVRHIAAHRYLRTQRGTRHIALLTGPFETWPDLVSAGRALMSCWLEMARSGVYIQPMGSMLTNPRYATAIAQEFHVSDCWLVMRMGYSAAPPAAPRLQSILLP